MEFSDRLLNRLAHPDLRANLLGDSESEKILDAAYATSTSDKLNVSAPFTPDFEQFKIGHLLQPQAEIHGTWAPLSNPAESTQASFNGTLPSSTTSHLAIDALWLGSITSTVEITSGNISKVSTTPIQLSGLDDEIISSQGSLPSDPQLLETARFQALTNLLASSVNQGNAIDAHTTSAFLKQNKAASVAELLGKQKALSHLGLTIQFQETGAGTQTTKTFPVCVALKCLENITPLRETISNAKLIQATLANAFPQQGIPEAAPLHPVVVAIICPETIFSDADWHSTPGTPNDQLIPNRIDLASQWLAAEGIALLTIS